MINQGTLLATTKMFLLTAIAIWHSTSLWHPLLNYIQTSLDLLALFLLLPQQLPQPRASILYSRILSILYQHPVPEITVSDCFCVCCGMSQIDHILTYFHCHMLVRDALRSLLINLNTTERNEDVNHPSFISLFNQSISWTACVKFVPLHDVTQGVTTCYVSNVTFCCRGTVPDWLPQELWY